MKKTVIFIMMFCLFLTACSSENSSEATLSSDSTNSEIASKEAISENLNSDVISEATGEASCEESSEQESEEPSSPPTSFLLSTIEVKGLSGETKIEMKYNNDGKLIESANYSNGKILSKITYEVDINGNVTEEATYSYNNSGNVSFYTKRTYTLDDSGIIQSCVEDTNGNVTTVTYEYDSEGRKTHSKSVDNNGAITEEIEYEYTDNNGSCTVFFISGIFQGETQKTIYDENGNLIEYSHTNAEGTVLSESVSEYDEHNRIIKSTNNDGVVTEYLNVYENGSISSVTVIFDGEETERTEYTYDKYGNIITEKVLSVTGTVRRETVNTWKPVYSE